MLDSIGYDFKDTKIKMGELAFAARIADEDNLYAPDPERIQVEQTEDLLIVRADGFISGGGQNRTEGKLELHICLDADGIYHISGSAQQPKSKLKAFLLLIEGIAVTELISDSENMPVFPVEAHLGTPVLRYPGREAMMPLVMAKTQSEEWFFLSKDRKPRQKQFEVHWTPNLWNGPVVTLGHYPDYQERSETLDLPEWKIGKQVSRLALVKERCSDLEKHFGLVPLAKRQEADWISKIRLIVNLHGEHWTGRVFQTYAEMGKRLSILCQEVPGEQILAFLPAWDGRYYRTYPLHEPSDALGGMTGLQEFLETAHKLGVHVVAMLGGPNLATYETVEKYRFWDAVMKTEHGDPLLQNWVDWDMDLVPESMGYLMNFGEPAYQDFMVKKTRTILRDYGFDGVFLDGAIRYDCCQKYSPIKGIQDYCRRVQKEFPDKILMGEDGYDLIWASFSMFATSWQPLGLEQAMLRYTRQSYYLAHPDLNGSGGVHEQGWNSIGSAHLLPQYTYPTLSITDGSMETEQGKARLKQELNRLFSIPPKRPEIVEDL